MINTGMINRWSDLGLVSIFKDSGGKQRSKDSNKGSTVNHRRD
jgi:hypothetical protein